MLGNDLDTRLASRSLGGFLKIFFFKDRITKKEHFFIYCLTRPNWIQQPEIGQFEAKSLELLVGNQCLCKDTSTWTILWCFPKREAGSNVEQLRLNSPPCGMLAPLVEA